MAHSSLDFSQDDLHRIIRKVYHALKPGGLFMITSDALDVETQEESRWRATTVQPLYTSLDRSLLIRALRTQRFLTVRNRQMDASLAKTHDPVDIILARKGH